ncbi:MAG: class I SAM-dependent methyltransferase [Sphingobacteriales bacterium]|nr:class I SAM-dependent methyltransferase [Sphingobacteriales bacterium]
MSKLSSHPASFKDPAGFIIKMDETYYRQVNKVYADDYQLLMQSGLYEKLTRSKKLLSHTEVDTIIAEKDSWYKTILPQQLEFISYPYEWCFDQLKDAALLTLQIQKEALSHGMSLKDATPFNVQWLTGKAVFIDTLSFEKYTEGEAWVAYKQFCENFLAPLLLMKYNNAELNKLLLNYPNGIPLTIVSSLLPYKTKFNLGIYLHIHLQAKFQKKKSGEKETYRKHLSHTQLQNIVDNLVNLVKKLNLTEEKTTWNNYYNETILSKEYLSTKEKLVNEFLAAAEYKSVLDLGANTGEFSLLAAKSAKMVVAADFDTACVQNLYKHTIEKKIKNIYPLVLNITNPTPAIGWANSERNSFWQRINTDLIMALALIHHLSISANINFSMLADLLKSKCRYLIIEFVPKTDPKVQQLLSYRKDVFTEYTETNFEESFKQHFSILKKEQIPSTQRIIYLMKTNH